MFGPATSSRQQQSFVSTGNETFDRFLGGGLLNSSLNLFERQGPQSRVLDDVLNNSLASSTLATGAGLIILDLNSLDTADPSKIKHRLPRPRSVKTELLYKDVRGRSAATKIKIAWRYSSRNASPSDKLAQTQLMDFGFASDNTGDAKAIGVVCLPALNFTLKDLLEKLDLEYRKMKQTFAAVNIILKDLLHPFSPITDNPELLLEFLFLLRCFSRNMEKGAILVTYDIDMCINHDQIKLNIYNLADCVVSFYSYETDQNILSGYKHSAGTLDYIKVPKLNSFGFHFQRELSDWGYRFTKNYRFFVIDELSLPPNHDEENDGSAKKVTIADEVEMFDKTRGFAQASPLEDFREVAKTVLSKDLF